MFKSPCHFFYCCYNGLACKYPLSFPYYNLKVIGDCYVNSGSKANHPNALSLLDVIIYSRIRDYSPGNCACNLHDTNIPILTVDNKLVSFVSFRIFTESGKISTFLVSYFSDLSRNRSSIYMYILEKHENTDFPVSNVYNSAIGRGNHISVRNFNLSFGVSEKKEP